MRTPMRKSAYQVRMLLMMVLLLAALTACQLIDQVVPTVIPPAVRDQPVATPAETDESPRLRNAQDIPPTWTPPAEIRSDTPIAPAVATPVPGSQGTYTVQQGDTLAEIALQYNVTLEALATANNIEDYDHIEVGQVLIIPGF